MAPTLCSLPSKSQVHWSSRQCCRPQPWHQVLELLPQQPRRPWTVWPPVQVLPQKRLRNGMDVNKGVQRRHLAAGTAEDELYRRRSTTFSVRSVPGQLQGGYVLLECLVSRMVGLPSERIMVNLVLSGIEISGMRDPTNHSRSEGIFFTIHHRDPNRPRLPRLDVSATLSACCVHFFGWACSSFFAALLPLRAPAIDYALSPAMAAFVPAPLARSTSLGARRSGLCSRRGPLASPLAVPVRMRHGGQSEAPAKIPPSCMLCPLIRRHPPSSSFVAPTRSLPPPSHSTLSFWFSVAVLWQIAPSPHLSYFS